VADEISTSRGRITSCGCTAAALRASEIFSMKLENFQAAIGLNFGYYNFVKTRGAIRCTPAMAAGVLPRALSVSDLVERVR